MTHHVVTAASVHDSVLRLFCVSVPLLLMVSVLASLGRAVERRFATPWWWGRFVFVGLGGLWLAASLFPPPDPVSRLSARLEQAARRLRGDVSVVVQDYSSGTQWHLVGERPFASVLAGLATLAHAGLERPSETVSLHDFTLAPGAPTRAAVVCTSADVVALLLSEGSMAAARCLMDLVGEHRLGAAAARLFGHSAFGAAQLGAPCLSCASLDVVSAREPEDAALQSLATTATLVQVLEAFRALSDHRKTGSEIVRAALGRPRDVAGLARHLQAQSTLYGAAFYTGHVREEVLLVSQGWETWGIAARYETLRNIAARTDSVANRMFGDMGWRVACYEEQFAGGLSVATAQGKDLWRPWFLRRGKTCWAERLPDAW